MPFKIFSKDERIQLRDLTEPSKKQDQKNRILMRDFLLEHPYIATLVTVEFIVFLFNVIYLKSSNETILNSALFILLLFLVVKAHNLGATDMILRLFIRSDD